MRLGWEVLEVLAGRGVMEVSGDREVVVGLRLSLRGVRG